MGKPESRLAHAAVTATSLLTTGPGFVAQDASGRCEYSLVRRFGRLVRTGVRMIGRGVVRRATLLAGAAIWIAAWIIGRSRVAFRNITRRIVRRTTLLTRTAIGVGVRIVGSCRTRISERRHRGQRQNRQASQNFHSLHSFLHGIGCGTSGSAGTICHPTLCLESPLSSVY